MCDQQWNQIPAIAPPLDPSGLSVSFASLSGWIVGSSAARVVPVGSSYEVPSRHLHSDNSFAQTSGHA